MRVSTRVEVTMRSDSWEAMGAFMDGLRSAIMAVRAPEGLSVLDLAVNSLWVEQEQEEEEA